jgi:hypothetical protein
MSRSNITRLNESNGPNFSCHSSLIIEETKQFVRRELVGFASEKRIKGLVFKLMCLCESQASIRDLTALASSSFTLL